MIRLPQPIESHRTFDLAVAFPHDHGQRGRRLPFPGGKGGDLARQQHGGPAAAMLASRSGCNRRSRQWSPRGGSGAGRAGSRPPARRSCPSAHTGRSSRRSPDRLDRVRGLHDRGEALAVLRSLCPGEFPDGSRGRGGHRNNRCAVAGEPHAARTWGGSAPWAIGGAKEGTLPNSGIRRRPDMGIPPLNGPALADRREVKKPYARHIEPSTWAVCSPTGTRNTTNSHKGLNQAPKSVPHATLADRSLR